MNEAAEAVATADGAGDWSLLKGRNPKHRSLFGPPGAWGYWALVNIDRVRSLDAQYHP